MTGGIKYWARLLPGYRRVLEQLERLQGQYEDLAARFLNVKNENEELQRRIEKQAKNREDLREQVERREQMIAKLQERLGKQEGIVQKVTQKLETVLLERDEIYKQYNGLAERFAESEKRLGDSDVFKTGQPGQVGQSDGAEIQVWRLNMGCGRLKKSGYLNVDVDTSVKPDLVFSLDQPLPFGSNVFELIEAYHVVEHVYPWAMGDILKELWRVLRPGGKLAIECPNIESACSWLARNSEYGWDSQMGMWAIYGDPNPRNPLQMHKWGYTPLVLWGILQAAGFVGIQRETPETHVPARDFRILAVKPNAGH